METNKAEIVWQNINQRWFEHLDDKGMSIRSPLAATFEHPAALDEACFKLVMPKNGVGRPAADLSVPLEFKSISPTEFTAENLERMSKAARFDNPFEANDPCGYGGLPIVFLSKFSSLPQRSAF